MSRRLLVFVLPWLLFLIEKQFVAAELSFSEECTLPALGRLPPGCEFNFELLEDGCPLIRIYCLEGECEGFPCEDPCEVCVNPLEGESELRCEKNETCASRGNNMCRRMYCPVNTSCKMLLGVGRCVKGEGKGLQPRCLEPIERGTCDFSETRWAYNQKKHACEEFSFTGCGGNFNRFRQKHQCKRTCRVEKDGFCPVVDSGLAGVCVEDCTEDDLCPGEEKCCFNGCGHSCTQPIFLIPTPEKVARALPLPHDSSSTDTSSTTHL